MLPATKAGENSQPNGILQGVEPTEQPEGRSLQPCRLYGSPCVALGTLVWDPKGATGARYIISDLWFCICIPVRSPQCPIVLLVNIRDEKEPPSKKLKTIPAIKLWGCDLPLPGYLFFQAPETAKSTSTR